MRYLSEIINSRLGPQCAVELIESETNFLGELFAGSVTRLALADTMDEIKTISDCGRKVIVNMRIATHKHKATQADPVEIGGNARYLAVCSHCFRLA